MPLYSSSMRGFFFRAAYETHSVVSVQGLGALSSLTGFCERLACAGYAAAGTCHYLHHVVADLALFYAVDEFIGVFQAADYGDFYLLAVMGDAALLEACSYRGRRSWQWNVSRLRICHRRAFLAPLLVTPPDAPNIRPAPLLIPKGILTASGSSSSKRMPL